MIADRKFVHDMKNMLGIVIGYSSLLLDELPASESMRADVEEIKKAGETALALLDSVNSPVPGEELT